MRIIRGLALLTVLQLSAVVCVPRNKPTRTSGNPESSIALFEPVSGRHVGKNMDHFQPVIEKYYKQVMSVHELPPKNSDGLRYQYFETSRLDNDWYFRSYIGYVKSKPTFWIAIQTNEISKHDKNKDNIYSNPYKNIRVLKNSNVVFDKNVEFVELMDNAYRYADGMSEVDTEVAESEQRGRREFRAGDQVVVQLRQPGSKRLIVQNILKFENKETVKSIKEKATLDEFAEDLKCKKQRPRLWETVDLLACREKGRNVFHIFCVVKTDDIWAPKRINFLDLELAVENSTRTFKVEDAVQHSHDDLPVVRSVYTKSAYFAYAGIRGKEGVNYHFEFNEKWR